MLDKHFGTIKMWQDVIDEIHARKMWVVLDNTMATYVTPPPPHHPSNNYHREKEI
jgi:glycosidase